MTFGSRFRFSSVVLLFAMLCEVEYKLFATYAPGAVAAGAIIYALYAQLWYAIHTRIDGWFSNRLRADWAFLLGAGFTGLVGLEWFFVGNTPSGNPEALQSGMFVFHATYVMLARLYADETEAGIRFRKRTTGFTVGFFVFSLAGFLIPDPGARRGWFIFLPLIAYFVLMCWSIRFFHARSRSRDG